MPTEGTPDPPVSGVRSVLVWGLAHPRKFGVVAAHLYPICASSPTTPLRRAHRHITTQSCVPHSLFIFSFSGV